MSNQYSNQTTDIVSSGGGCRMLTTDADGKAQGPDEPCREVWIQSGESNTVYVEVDGEADSYSFPAPRWNEGPPLRVPIDNTNRLYFDSTVSDAPVYLLWRD